MRNLKILFTFLLLPVSITAYSQKLPNIQESNIYAPANIKIDGKTLEWPDNKLQAFNKANDIWYTISNDDETIYLTIRAPYKSPVEKIIGGGITFTITPYKERKYQGQNDVSVTFPVLKRGLSDALIFGVRGYEMIKHDTLPNKKKLDSLVTSINGKADNIIKEIKVKGIQNLDTLISIYNTDGIKAMGQFDRNIAFIYELAIPIKYLDRAVIGAAKFSYNIKLNGETLLVTFPNGTSRDWVPTPSPKLSPEFLYVTYPTDLWGEYTLAKKP